MRGPRRVVPLLLLLIVVFVGGLTAWARTVELDISAAGIGRVIPSSQVQTVQNLEGGIVAEVLVREGDRVEASQVVARIDDTGLASSLREDRSTYLRLSATAARLGAEAAGKPLAFDEEVTGSPEGGALVAAEEALFESRRQSLHDAVYVLAQEAAGARKAAASARSRGTHLEHRLKAVKEELDIVVHQVAAGLVSKVEALKLEGRIAEIEEQRTIARGEAAAAEARGEEAAAKIAEKRSAFVSAALEDLNQIRLKRSALKEKLVAHRDRVTRSNVRSPVKGVIKTLSVTTAGAVLKPGDPIMEIVPLEDALLIEARIDPRDIAFIRPGQEAQVRVTAYDFSVYGALPGRVERVGADTTVTRDEESFYPVTIRVDDARLPAQEHLPIMPGMVADVSIVTGSRSILDYLLKPVYKLKERAWTER